MGPSKLRALYILDKAQARAQIVEAYRTAQGNGRRAAAILEVEYQTVARFIKSDPVLAQQIIELRKEFRDAGIPQRGYGGSVEQRLSEYRDNPRPYRS